MNAPEHITPPANSIAVASLPVAAIAASPSNPRKHFDAAYLAELAESIKAQGVIQPITVRPLSLDGLFAFNRSAGEGDERPIYEIVVGECRWRAAKLAGLIDIPAFWRELSDKEVLEIQIVENLARRDVHPLEEAAGYQALIARHGYTADQLAARIGKSRSYIFGRLKLTALRADGREAFFAGKLDASTALLVARIPGEALQKRATKEIINGYNGEPLSYRAAQMHIRSRYTLNLQGATFKPDDATLLPAAGACSACPKRSGSDPDLFGDIDSADICTDPDCFEAKRLARRDQLIANAEKHKIPVITDTELARRYFHLNDHIALDDTCEDDAQERTYREILGDKAPVAALVQGLYGNKDMVEFAEAGAIEKALKKAGWTPRADDGHTIAGGLPTDPNAAAKRAEAEAERKAREEKRERLEKLADEEQTLREEALAASMARLHALTLDTDKTTEDILYLLAEAWFRNLLDINELSELEDGIRTHLDAGYTLPEEFDDADEIPRAIEILRQASPGRVVAFLLADMVRSAECHINQWHLTDDHDPHAAPHILAPLTRLLGVPFVSVTHPASTPSPAAPAGGDSPPAAKAKKPTAKKAKAKADTAPATQANEAAAPPKTNNLPAWPFPTGDKP